ncbi:hypothetical protein FSP39_005107 [Pinctada imbricata]|uniref:Uncharacterized protein n=1 Tax=Pinctada imbricata TaxID=66713 RepID=A0AA89C0T9_PINIB|nr:hypothetical protein FSP39_005107 [Pinctada imbricata]
MGTNCAPLLADIFLYSYEAEFIQSLVSEGKRYWASYFNFTYRYIDDVLSINNPNFADYLSSIYPSELEVKETTETNNSASYLDLMLSYDTDGHMNTSLYDKRDDFNFSITNFPFLSSNIPSSPAYGVFISQLIRFARASTKYTDFVLRARRLHHFPSKIPSSNEMKILTTISSALTIEHRIEHRLTPSKQEAPVFCGLVCVWSSDSEEVVLHHNCTFFETSGSSLRTLVKSFRSSVLDMQEPLKSKEDDEVAEGIPLIDYLQKGQTINGTYYASLLAQLRKILNLCVAESSLVKGEFFHQDSAPVHKSVTAVAAIHDCGFNLIEHQPYSPDLAPSDFHLFPKVKEAISGTHFPSDDDVILAVDGFLTSQEKEFIKSGIEAL